MDSILQGIAQVIAWLTHHLPTADGKLIGGAEMTDQKLLNLAPEKVIVYGPNEWQKAIQADKLIITGTDLLTDEAMIQLAKVSPVIMVHHLQTKTEARQKLLSSASLLICHTPRHLQLELEWTTPKKSTWILSPHKPSDFQIKPKENFALWAARLHQQKGPLEAMVWASKAEIPLLMLYDKPRPTVLEAMSRAKHFVFLPTSFDAEPRTLIEAVLSGCLVTTNHLAGISSIVDWNKPEVMADLVSNAGQKFWETVL